MTGEKAPISVIVATFGDPSWQQTAERALASVRAQRLQPAELIVIHGENLAQARNEGGRQATAPWLCFLDADDELHPRFLSAMSRVLNPAYGLFYPAVQFITDGRERPPRLFAPRDLSKGNYLVIATVMPADLFWMADGFDPRWPAWEDWQTFRKMVALGGKPVPVKQAVYRAHWNANGRNNTVASKDALMAEMRGEFDEWQAARV